MKNIKIMGIDLVMFAVIAVVIVAACALGVLPEGMVGAFLFLMVFGALLNQIGNVTPIIKTFLGGGAIVCIFGGAALVYLHVIPEAVDRDMHDFHEGRRVPRFLHRGPHHRIHPRHEQKTPHQSSLSDTCLASSGLSALRSCSYRYSANSSDLTSGESVAYIGIPIMGGGMGAGAVPISKVFESALGIPAEQIMSRLVPAVALGNAFAIVCGGLLNRLGQVFPKLTGNGQLVISNDESLKQEEVDIEATGLGDYATGLVVATCFFAFGSVVAKLIAMLGLDIHPYAWMIISVAVAKCTGIIPEKYENAAAVWYKFVSTNWTGALMLGIGIAYTDMGQIIEAMTPTYIVLVFVVVLGAIIGAGVIGRLVGFYPIEAAITAGLCMANMGGTGDVAVLMASKRMELMPFAQISSRLGGAFIILMASVMVPIFFA